MWWTWLACTDPSGPGTPAPPPVDRPSWSSEPVEGTAHARVLQALLPTAEALEATCVAADDPEERHHLQAPADRLHARTVYGLLADTDYACALTAGPWSGEVAFRTPPPEADLPTWTTSGAPFDGYLLLNHGFTGGPRKARLLVVDGDGRLRWSRRIWDDPPDVDAQYLGDGQILYGGGFGVPPTWIDLSGEVLRRAPAPSTGLVYHHHVERIDTAEVMTLALSEVEGDDGAPFADFTIEILDPSLTARTWVWDSARGRQEGWLPPPAPGQDDPYHANALAWADGDVFVNLRHRHQLIRLDRQTGDRVWTLGLGGDFALIDADGRPLPDAEWFYGAHAPELDLPRVLLYDNGWSRPGAAYSRLLELELDEVARTAKVVWTWTEPGWYEPIWGDVDRLPDGRVQLVRAHCGACKPGQVTEVVEVDPATGEVVWRLTFDTEDDAGFRAERIDGCALFANERYCPSAD